MSDMAALAGDLEAETAALVYLVEGMEAGEWDRPTPSDPWTVSDQVGHLAYFDEQAALAVTDPEGFVTQVNEAALAFVGDVVDFHRARRMDGPSTLAWFRGARGRLLDALADLDPERRIPWYGPPMRARSFVVARLMETWAHGTDVADALGAALPVTDRLFHIADLGVRTFSWSFSNRSLEVPAERVRVSVTGPSGSARVWNEASTDSIGGPVEDFCLVVTQRRHVDDTSLDVDGEIAHRWMEVAQVFAGPPGPGRPPSRKRSDGQGAPEGQ